VAINSAKLSSRDILRTQEDIYKELELAKKDLSDDALVDLMIQHLDLIRRPIVEKRERAILTRGGGKGQ
jgi:arsenate reductase